MKQVNILIADPQYLVRQGLKYLLSEQPHFAIAGECSDKHTLFRFLRELSIDIVILDHTHQENFNTSDISLIRTISPSTRILMIADISEKDTVQQIIDYGVTGFLTKTCDSAEILEAIKCLLNGEKMFCHKVVDLLLNFPVKELADCEPTVLSEREIEIIRLISNGYTTKEIADTLYRSFHTISTHRKNIMKKLAINTTSELLVYAMNTGLIMPVNTQSPERGN